MPFRMVGCFCTLDPAGLLELQPCGWRGRLLGRLGARALQPGEATGGGRRL